MIDANEFVDELRLLAPDREELIEQGLDDEDVAEILSLYECKKKKGSGSVSGNPILDLLLNYDLSNLEIGEVTFMEKVKYERGYLVFGSSEANILSINTSTDCVEVRDLTDPDYVMYICATTPSLFLDSLIQVARYLRMEITDDKSIFKAAEDCSKLSGSEKSLNYYLTLLGYQKN